MKLSLTTAPALQLVCLLLLSVASLLAVTINASANEGSVISQPVQIVIDRDASELTVRSDDVQWNIVLTEKALLGSTSQLQQALFSIPVFYEGSVVNKADSWVRLTQSVTDPTVLTGHIYVDDTLFGLQHTETTDAYSLTTHGDVHIAPLPASLGKGLRAAHGKATSRMLGVAPKAIKIGIVIDSQYNSHYNQRGLAQALGVINGVDGLYQNQLGLALVVESFTVYDDPTEDPLRNYSGTVEQVLDYYRNIRLNDTELPAELALVHLFSGHVDPQKVIGLGWIDTVCRDDGYDLSMSTPFAYDILLAAHEIAHNLGAIHDDEENCSTDPSLTGAEIMWSELSGETQPQFSACSLDRMRSALNASCMADNIDVTLQVAATPLETNSEHEIFISAINLDATRIARAMRTTTRFPAGTQFSGTAAGCSISGNTLNCLHGNLPASTSSTVSVFAGFADSQSPVITSELVFSEFIDTQHLDNRASVQVSMNQITSSADIGPAVWHAETTSNQPTSLQPSDDDAQVGGSAGERVGSARLIDIMALALFGALAHLRRSRIFKSRPDQ